MELKLVRAYKCDTYTIGHVYRWDEVEKRWVFICDSCEDKDRGLDQSMSEANILALKVKHKTAIPTGRYQLTLDVVSPKFAAKPLYKEFCGGKIPRFKYVKGFSGVCFHSGVDADSSSGCPCVGENKVVGKLVNSWATFKRFYRILKRAANNGEELWVTVCYQL